MYRNSSSNLYLVGCNGGAVDAANDCVQLFMQLTDYSDTLPASPLADVVVCVLAIRYVGIRYWEGGYITDGNLNKGFGIKYSYHLV